MSVNVDGTFDPINYSPLFGVLARDSNGKDCNVSLDTCRLCP